MLVTEEILKQAISSRGGYSRKQLALIGVQWPPKSGWKRSVLGKDFPSEVLKQFIEIKAG